MQGQCQAIFKQHTYLNIAITKEKRFVHGRQDLIVISDVTKTTFRQNLKPNEAYKGKHIYPAAEDGRGGPVTAR